MFFECYTGIGSCRIVTEAVTKKFDVLTEGRFAGSQIGNTNEKQSPLCFCKATCCSCGSNDFGRGIPSAISE